MSGWKDWQQLEVVNESDFQNFVQDQVVQVYATSAARSTALGLNVEEGMVSYLKDTNSVEVYDGLAWAAVAPKSGNYIINGGFDFWQRGTSFTGLTADAYTADRWEYSDSGATVTISQQAFTPNDLQAIGYGEGQYFLRYDVTTGNANNSLLNKIEDVRTLAGQTVTLSFWAKADAAYSSFSPYMLQGFGSGGSSLSAFGTGQFASLTTSWQRFSFNYTVPSISGKTIGAGSYLAINLVVLDTETPTIDIWGVQLEAGSVATPFRRNANSLQGELAACQRYYFKAQVVSQGTYYVAGQAYATQNYPVEMRANPSLTFGSAASFNVWSNGSARAGTSVSNFSGTKLGTIYAVSTSNATAGDGAFVTDGTIEASAEL